jgi:hypothetical protein
MPPAPSGLELKDSIMRNSALFFILLLTQYHVVFTLRRLPQCHLVFIQRGQTRCKHNMFFIYRTIPQSHLVFILPVIHPWKITVHGQNVLEHTYLRQNISAAKHIGTKLIGYKMYRMKIISATKCIGGQNVSPASNF